MAKKTTNQELTEKILTKQGKKFPEWKKATIEKTQIEFFQGKDTDLETYVIDREMTKLVQNECKKNLKNTNNTNGTKQGEN